MKRKLQVFIGNNWEYVFCHNGLQSNPVTTKEASKAIPFNSLSLAYFEMKHSEHNFKSSS